MADEVSHRYPILYTGRGLRGEQLDDDTVELSVNLLDLGEELDQALLRFELRDGRVWLPLTTSVGGVPELVWEADDSLVPTHVPVPPTGVEDMSSGIGTGDPTGGGP